MTPEQLALLTDTRLSSQARLMGLWRSEHADGWLRVEASDWALLVGRGTRGAPKRQQLASWFAEWRMMTLLGSAGAALIHKIPPPLLRAELPLMTLLEIVGEATSQKIPPPPPAPEAELPLMTLLEIAGEAPETQ